ncbi:Gfo/Idh/MocA family oxidoreductase [Mycetocola sp. 2940]|uniref:Gfo/Idh/MocA family protein n=1 Tax=Mycetocola sp. 2940 TaxID=3156452 RepID=UPI003397F095
MTTIAIIGAGYMGRTHAAAWAALGHGDGIRYICSRREGSGFAEAPAARVVTDLASVLADPEVDIVSVCTPTTTHRDIAVRALNAGKHVLLEKPIALTIADALAISAAASASSRTFMVAHVVRFFEGYRRAREDVEAGRIGTVLSARARRLITKPDSAWWYDDEKSGGVVVDVGIHDFDQMNLFLGPPVAVTSTANDPLGPIETTIDYRSGAIGQVLTFAGVPAGAPFTTSLNLVGTAGLLDYEFSADAPTAAGGTSGVNAYRLATANGASSTTLAPLDPYRRQAEYFLECVRTATDPGFSPTASAVRALEVALAARQSLISGETVPLEERA